MAIIHTLGVVCASNAALASQIARHYASLTISIPGIADIACEASIHEIGKHHLVEVFPVGMGVGLPPGHYPSRPELLEPANVVAIREALYLPLKSFPGFRYARFDVEAAGQMMSQLEGEEIEVLYPHTIFHVDLATRYTSNLAPNCLCRNIAWSSLVEIDSFR
ncbi:hypothetical protein [Bremerella cremea]|uniref:hypothetical protein n=1 Tax=Bremerella cremea TaxID=1031537 RepID=UPI0031F0DC35